MTTVDLLMRDLLDTEQELNLHEHALDDIYNRISRGEEVVSIIELKLDACLDDFHRLASRICTRSLSMIK